MAFEMQVVGDPPLTGESDPKRVARLLLERIGYTARRGPDNGLGFRIFYDCFLLHPAKWWTVEELASHCETTMPSVYRHLNKLKDLDLIEDGHIEDGDDRRLGFRMRYGDLSKAWNHAEVHFDHAIQSYRASIDHLESLAAAERN